MSKNHHDAYNSIKDLTCESVIEASGKVKAENQAPGGFEIEAEEIKTLSLSSPILPIPMSEKIEKEASLDKRLDWRWLDLRKSKNKLIFQVWTTMEQAMRNYWTSNGYIQIHSPKLMSSPSEGSAELFEIKYFDRKAYLAQSPQFYKQMAMAAGFGKVFEIGPVFRANPSFTSRHDTEFTSYDMELSYIDSHFDIMAEEEKVKHAALDAISKQYGEAILEEYGRKIVVPKIPFPKITMAEAKAKLKLAGVTSDKEDLSPEEEREICKIMKKETGHEFVFVTDFPVNVRPFYHMRNQDGKTTKSYDLLWNGIEATTGAQREHRYDILVKQAKEKGIGLESIKFYLDFFKYGCPPHGGCGFGPTRMLMKIFDIENVREVTFLYRGVKRLEP